MECFELQQVHFASTGKNYVSFALPFETMNRANKGQAHWSANSSKSIVWDHTHCCSSATCRTRQLAVHEL